MPVKLNSSGGGSVTLTTPSTATDYTATFPASTGTVLTTGAAVTVAQGGTGQTSFTTNGLLYASGTTTLVNGSNVIYDGSKFQVSSKQSYLDPNLTGSGGLNISASYSYNNNTSNSIGTYTNVYAVFYVNSSAGVSVIPLFSFGGNGVAYRYAALDPDTGWVVNSSGLSFSFAETGTSGNTYTFAIASGSGSATIQRTAGSLSYFVYVQLWGS